MTTPMLLKRLVLAAPCLLGIGLLIAAADAPSPIAGLRQAFEKPPADARMMARWWWFGAAVTKPELAKEIRAMKQGGFGGFEVQPVYPLVLDDPQHNLVNLPYMSDGFLDALKFAAETGRAEGMRFDLTLCSGWPYGGPHIPIGQASGRLRMDRVEVSAGAAKVEIPKLADGDSFVAAFLAKGNGRQFSPEGIQRLTDVVRFHGSLAGGQRGRRGAVLHRQPYAPAGQAAGRGLRGVGARPLQPRGSRSPPQDRRRPPDEGGGPQQAIRRLQRQPGGLRRRLDPGPSEGVPKAPRLRSHAVSPRPRRRHRPQHRRHPARLGTDAHRTFRGQLPQAAHRVGPQERHAVPLAELRHPARSPLQQRPGGSARRAKVRNGGDGRPRAGPPRPAI